MRLKPFRLEHRRVSALNSKERRIVTYSKATIRKLERAVRSSKFVPPVIVDRDGKVLLGHAYIDAAGRLGIDVLPCLIVDDENSLEAALGALAHERILREGEFADDALKKLFKEIEVAGFDLGVTGFEMSEIDIIIGEPDTIDVVPTSAGGQSISRIGDRWACGPHHVICGDARDAEAYSRLLPDELARLIVTDPPYNVSIGKHALTSSKHADFAMASGEMSESEFIEFLQRFLTLARKFSLDGALFYVAMDWRHLFALESAARAAGLSLFNFGVWAKTNAGMGSYLRSQHECFPIYKSGKAAHVNNNQLGKHGRNRSNLWTYSGQNAFAPDRDATLSAHPTIKPTDLVVDAILDASHRGDWVLDPFLGSGTTLIAAERTGRRCAGIELEPGFVDVALERWAAFTGEDPVRESDKASWRALAARRAA